MNDNGYFEEARRKVSLTSASQIAYSKMGIIAIGGKTIRAISNGNRGRLRTTEGPSRM